MYYILWLFDVTSFLSWSFPLHSSRDSLQPILFSSFYRRRTSSVTRLADCAESRRSKFRFGVGVITMLNVVWKPNLVQVKFGCPIRGPSSSADGWVRGIYALPLPATRYLICSYFIFSLFSMPCLTVFTYVLLSLDDCTATDQMYLFYRVCPLRGWSAVFS
jgi:hypothetical protein